ncbi:MULTISPECIES: dioxygenase family protein [Pseudomonas]|uniref:6-chlorohydroxyquinol-1,2-dioxygenase n=1 Tax=Pseudomonas gingeri TaxID=117681 RepID=A0A7Y7WVJ1_9PSED|nr:MULTISPECIES: dioxygenase [Pseudomonas]MPQ68426.1 6-chlorohydroxyquinol-1,2-dioxygenase [Pseudomonas sp. MWU12-2323]NWB88499.1 6-chlorohydroxyquinol-1,2-dioxygenase [Pseudomonas gingeri]
MRNLDEMTITQAVLANNSGTADARLCAVMTSLVQHLHAFARDIKLTEKEWQSGIDFLSQVGKTCSADHQEFVLLSHVLGLSTLVLAQNDKKPAGCTEAAAFHVLPEHEPSVHDLGADLSGELDGPKGYVHGSVRDAKGNPIPYAALEISLAAGASLAERALLQADERGQYHFCTAIPNSQRIPHDGPVGQLLSALNRHAWRPAHLEFTVSAAGYQRLTTQVFREGDPYLDSDAVFGVRSSLITEWQRQDAGMTPAGTLSRDPFYSLAFDFVLAKDAVS